MKTLSGTLAFVALTVVAIVMLPSCCRKRAVLTEKKCYAEKFALEFGKLGPDGTPTEYVEVDKKAFDAALCKVKSGQYNVEFRATASASPIPNYTPPCPPESVNTDKITTSEVARAEPAKDSSAYDPNAVYRVQSNSLQEIRDVLASFKETASPTPTP